MQHFSKSSQILKYIVKQTSLILALFFTGFVSAQNIYMFTCATATGNLGPTQAQINAAYFTSNLNGNVASTNGIQSWTVPCSGPYKITAYGAQGGGNGGFGAKMEGRFNLTAGQILKILVGQQGICGTGATANNNGGGGGGGSFVVTATNSLLIAAGGGGGGLIGAPGGNGLITTSGGSSYFGGCGNNGNGGYSGITNGDAAGGGGYLTNGQNSANIAQSPCEGGRSFLNGANGGISGTNGQYFGGHGGFGGGGSGWHNSINRGGGGGGYSGGQGGTLNSSPPAPGGGGGSFNGGSNQQNTEGDNSGNGSVVITSLYYATIVQTATIQCNNSSTGALSSNITGGSAPYTYTWQPGGGNLSLANNLAAGIYTLVVKDNNNLLTSSTYTITQPAPIIITATANNTNVCSGSTVILNGGGANVYSWSGGVSNGIGFIANNTNTYVVTGTNTLSGCSSTAAINIIVKPSPTLSVNQGSICTGNSFTIIPNGAVSYTYSNGSAIVNPSATTSYTVTGISNQGCVGNLAITTITVNALPSLTLSASINTMCANGTQIVLSGLPTGGNYLGTNVVGNIFTALTSGTFAPAYSYTNSNTGCSNIKTTAIIIDVCTNISVSENKTTAKFYPNPTMGLLNIETNDDSNKIIHVLDLAGRTVLAENTINKNFQLDISNLAIGIYYVMIKTVNGTQVSKIIKE